MEALLEILPKDKGWFGYTGLRALRLELEQIERRHKRGRIWPDDVVWLQNIEQTRREIVALGRAKRWADQQRTIHPLNLVRKQMNELQVDNLGLRCLNVEDLMVIRKEWPDWQIGDDIDLSAVPVSQRMPEREREGDNTGGSVTTPASDADPGTPDPPV